MGSEHRLEHTWHLQEFVRAADMQSTRSYTCHVEQSPAKQARCATAAVRRGDEAAGSEPEMYVSMWMGRCSQH